MIDTPPSYEEVTKKRLDDLQNQMAVYEEVQERGDAAATEVEAQRVAAAMRDVGDSQNNPKVKKEWHKRAEKFTRAANSARKGILKEVGNIVIGVLSIPFQVAGTALSIVGGVAHGMGGLLMGVGDVVKGGPDKVTNAIAGSSRDGGNVAPNPGNGDSRGTDGSSLKAEEGSSKRSQSTKWSD